MLTREEKLDRFARLLTVWHTKYDDGTNIDIIAYDIVYMTAAQGWSVEEGIQWGLENSQVIEKDGRPLRILTRQAGIQAWRAFNQVQHGNPDRKLICQECSREIKDKPHEMLNGHRPVCSKSCVKDFPWLKAPSG
ncbi:hypothetical protein C8P63_10629 [Melghirimyces profundicolus]|uniref:Uncharacterized protein n=1 Tax=Melghirimyces profundicolus TaxID=1242148 RepID=A0A2T6C0K9_9BACL|nr:hypothetical protein [Melghirimyces profundicolus]PTX61777.1 hypothetical protein C8P63_10629 [Melghirimyces profundicolus]